MALEPKIAGELKEKLLAEKKNLEENISQIATPVSPKKGDYEPAYENLGDDVEDNATEVEEYSRNVSVEETLEKRLREIIAALERMEKGTYGFCENCQEEIDVERLKANPAAATCLKCQK